MDDGGGARSPARRGSSVTDDRSSARGALVAVLAAVVVALAVVAAVASPPAGADDVSGRVVTPMQADPAGPTGAVAPAPEGDGQRPGTGDGGALAQWMLAEVAVLVIGCAVWCRRSNRRRLRRVVGVVSPAEGHAPEPRPAPRFRL